MQITDYETGRALHDVSIALTREEAEELISYLGRLVNKPEIRRVYLSEIVGCHFEREITLSLEEGFIWPQAA